MCPRRYESPRRHAAAQATRVRILEAARALVGGKDDLSRFSVEAVAEKAGVSRMTVYYQFRSRARLLDELADHLAARGGMARMREAFAAPTLEAGIRRLVSVFVGFWASDRVTMRRLRAMGVVFPVDAKGPRDRDEWRREAIRRLLDRHGFRASRSKGRGMEDVVDALSALTGFDTFDQLRRGSRNSDEVQSILSDLAIELVLRTGTG